MYGLFVGLIVFASVILTIAVLIQNPKGGGVSIYGGTNIFSPKQEANIIEKITWWCAAAVIVFSIAATASISSKRVETKSDLSKELQKSAPTNNIPAFPVGGEQQGQEEANEQPAE